MIAGRLRHDIRGFTLVEVMVAMIILAGGIAATVATLDNSRKLSSGSEREVVAASIGQREIERISALSYDAVALRAVPPTSTDSAEPGYWMKPCPGDGSNSCYQWDHGASPSASTRERLVVDASAGDPAPNPTEILAPGKNGRTRIRVVMTRYITWVDDATCTSTGCAGTTDYKRVTVAVKVAGNGPKRPVILSTILRDQEGGVQNPLNDPGVTCTYSGASVPCAL